MRTGLIILLVLLLVGGVVFAQDCGDGLPCGPIPWTLPNYPVLISPTAILGDGSVLTPTPTGTPTPTRTPTHTPTDHLTATPFWDPQIIDDHIATAEGLLEGTEIPVVDAQGTPVGDIGGNPVIFFEYARGLVSGETFGPFTPLLALMGVGLGFSFLLAVFQFTLPIAAVILGLLLKIISFIIKAIRG